MNFRTVLNGIAALCVVGMLGTFAFSMVGDAENVEMPEEYYCDTETETDVLTETETEVTTSKAATANKITERLYNREMPELPQTNDYFRIKSRMSDAYGYMASPEDGTDLVITPIYSGEPETPAETEVTYVPVLDDEEAFTESAGAVSYETEEDITASDEYESESMTADTENVPDDSEDETVTEIFPEENSQDKTKDISQSYAESLSFSVPANTPSEEEISLKLAQMQQELTEKQDVVQVQNVSETEFTQAVTEEIFTSAPTETSVSESIAFTEPSFETVPFFTEPEPQVFPSGESFTAKFEGEVQEIDAYELVCMIVSTEMSPSFSPEALKAQAVAAYSYVKYHNVNGLVPTVLVKHEIPPEVTEAVNAVWGQCCYYNGKVAQTMYTASTAGTTASAVNVWGGRDVPYLTSVPTPIDYQSDPNYGVTAVFSEDYMKDALERSLGVTLSDNPANWLVITNRIDGNYVSGVSIDGQTNVSGITIREKVLRYQLKCWAFDVSYADGEFTFTTYGYGHGVGMSQNGANYLGKQGYTYDQILAYYFPGIYIE